MVDASDVWVAGHNYPAVPHFQKLRSGIARSTARDLGETHYIGAGCKNGHSPLRFVSTRQCVECLRERSSLEDKKARYEKTGRSLYRSNRERYPWANMVKNARARARKIGVPFDLTTDWARDRWTGMCELSGIPFDNSYTGIRGSRPFSPSIDRIHPEKGYVKGNCWIILFAYNAAKGKGTIEDLMRLFGRGLTPTPFKEVTNG